MYVEAICPLCFASHVVPEDMRGEPYRCEECEEEFVVSKKAKRTSKKPSRLREVKPADEAEAEPVVPVEAAEVAEVLPEANLVDAPPKKPRPRAEDEEVLDIPEDAVQGGAPVLKTPPAPKRRRDEDEEDDRPKKRRRADDEDEDDRPKKRRPARRTGPSAGLIVGLSAGAVMLFGLLIVSFWLAFPKLPEEKAERAQANVPPANNAKPNAADNQRPKPPEVGKQDKPREPPRNEPPKENPPPPKKDPPKPPPKFDPPAGAWEVKADPPAAAVKMPAAFKKEIPVPGIMPELTFPAGPSPFVAIGSNRAAGDERQVWNLETGQMTGKVVGAIQTQANFHPVLSPDGAHLAFLSARRGTVEIWAPASGKMVTAQVSAAMPTDLFEFAGPDKLLYGHRAGTSLTVKVIDAATGKEDREFQTPRPFGGRDGLAVSPGGAYLAVVERESLNVYDVRTGTRAGQRALTSANGLAPGTCHGLSFSPDGREVAGLFFGANGAHVICWDAVTGEGVSELSVPKALPQAGWLAVYRGHAIDWVGDRRGWLLYGYTFVDRTKNGSMTALAEPPATGSPIPRHLIGRGHAVTLAAGARAGEKVLTVGTFDPDKP
jgi:hypothetical protein